MATGEMSFVGLNNYRYLLTNDRFWMSMWNTCKYSAAKLIFDTSLALFIAVQLDKNIPLKKFLRSTYFAPVVVPMVASSLIWIWFYDPQVGPFNQILSFFGLPELKWLYSEHTAMISILLFSIWKGLGYNVVLFLSGLQNISDSYLEAARLDGASEWKLFWKIKFPLLRPITNFVVIMCIINSFKVFTEINVMTPDGGPLGSTLLIVNYIYEQAFTNGRMGRASAAALLLFVVIFILTQIRSAMDARKSVDYE
jgi:ABC-type sugar transport system permease subunit